MTTILEIEMDASQDRQRRRALYASCFHVVSCNFKMLGLVFCLMQDCHVCHITVQNTVTCMTEIIACLGTFLIWISYVVLFVDAIRSCWLKYLPCHFHHSISLLHDQALWYELIHCHLRTIERWTIAKIFKFLFRFSGVGFQIWKYWWLEEHFRSH